MTVVNALIKWAAQLAVALSAGLLVIIFLSANLDIPAFILRIMVLLAVALMSAFTARVFFHRSSPVLIILTAIAASLLAVLIIDHYYRSAYRFAFLDNQFRINLPTIADASQFILLFLASLPPILIFRRAKKQLPRRKKPIINLNRFFASLSSKTHQFFKTVNPKNWRMWNQIKPQRKVSIKHPHLKTPVQKLSVAVPARSGAKKGSPPVRVNKPAKNIKPVKTKLPGRFFRKSDHDVTLVGEEEHVCPYCLEEVHKNDSRGVMVCQECGTWHHLDCWDLTGACGVAHRNEL